MPRARSRRWVVLFLCLTVTLLPACRKDPAVRKQEFLTSGNNYFAKEQYREAAIEYLNAIKEDQNFVEARYQLAQSYFKMQLYTGAFQELLRTVDLKPDHIKAQIDLGNLLLGGRQFEEAAKRANLVLALDSKNVDAHILLANSYAAMQNTSASLEEMQKAVQLDPERAQSFLNLGFLQLGARQMGAAEASFKRARELSPQSANPMLALGSFYAAQKRWAEAEPVFRRAVQVEPKNPATYANLARLYYAQQKTSEIEQLLTQAKKAMADVPAGYRLLGDFHIATNNKEKSLAEYASLHQQHPDDAVVSKVYAQLLLGADRMAEAEQLLQQIQQKNPRDVELQILRAQILLAKNQALEALPILQGAAKAEPNHAVVHFQLGRAFAATGNTNRAEGEWREALRLNPNYLAAQEAVVSIAMQKADWNQVETLAQEMIKNDPAGPNGYLHRAAARAAKLDLSGAETDVKSAMDRAPQSPVPHIRMGGIKTALKRYPEAERAFERALELDAASVPALQGLIMVYNQQKLPPTRAVARVNAQVAKAPHQGGHYLLLGAVHQLDKDWDKAEAALVKATDLEPKNPQGFVALGQLREQRKSPDGAAAAYQRAIEAAPKQALPHVLLGSLEEKRNNWQRAQQLYETALQVERDFPLAANNLAYLLLEHGGNVDQALSYAQVARQALPGMPNTADTLAWAYYRKGVYASAIDLLKEALKANPKNATYHFHIGMAYSKSNDAARARQHLLRSLELNANSPYAGEIRQTLQQLK